MRPTNKIWVSEVPIDDNLNLSYEEEDKIVSAVDVERLYESLPPLHREICKRVVSGYSFNEVASDMGIPKGKIYKIKAELQEIILTQDMERYKRFQKRAQKDVDKLMMFASQNAGKLPLADFVFTYINAYDGEAQVKDWKRIPIQNMYEDIWDGNQRSCTLAPREHIKTTSLLQKVIKWVFNRKYPLEINYYHLTDELANEKFTKLKRYVQMSPLLSENFKLRESTKWNSNEIELADGTVIKPMSYSSGSIGKHPHIIILDDVIDKRVVYSDELNKKSIDNFYSVIYPQISKEDPDKKIVIIGTVQRKDDLYHRLPNNIKKFVYSAIKEDGTPLEPVLFSLEALHKIKADISSNNGERFWLKEYMNKPFDAMGFIVKKEHIRYYKYAPANLKIYQGWDLSVGKDIEKGDWTVGATVGIDDTGDKVLIYVLDIFRARLDFNQRLRALSEKGNQWLPTQIGIEEVAFQYDTVAAFKNKTLFSVVGVKAIKSKIESFQVELAPYFENGQVLIREDMTELESELLTLPVGEYDDQADALKIAIKVALQSKTLAPIISFV